MMSALVSATTCEDASARRLVVVSAAIWPVAKACTWLVVRAAICAVKTVCRLAVEIDDKAADAQDDTCAVDKARRLALLNPAA